MKLHTANRVILDPAMFLLPSRMDGLEARAISLAICLQESDLQHRIQLIGHHRHWWESLKGPARGLSQFEWAGVNGVMGHPASKYDAENVLKRLSYPHDDPDTVYRAMAHNDVLMACFTRLALWRLPESLPGEHEAEKAWGQYLEVWRPGKPKRERWDSRYERAWEAVKLHAA